MPYIQDWIQNKFRCETLKAHRTTAETSPTAGAWTDCGTLTSIAGESSGDALSLNADNKTVEINRDGIYFFGGCVHFQNNSGGNVSLLVGCRLIINPGTDDIEMRCSQRAEEFDQQDGGEGVLTFTGATASLSAGDTVRLQYYTNSTDIDFDSNDAFDSSVAWSITSRWCGVAV